MKSLRQPHPPRRETALFRSAGKNLFGLKPAALAFAVLALAALNSAAATRFWDGGGTTDFWDTAANWSNNVAPVNGDALIFPTNAARLINTNRAAANLTNVDFIRFTGLGYNVFSVSSLNLTNGITNAAPVGGSNTLSAALQLRRNQAWAIGGRTALTISSNVICSGLFVTNDVAGTLIYRGNLTGTGATEVNKTGSGRMILDGPTNAISTVRVLDGTLEVDGMLTASTFSISNSAALSGSGTTTAFTCAGDFQPGGNADSAIFTMTGAGTAVFQSDARFFVNLDGLEPGSGHDQFKTPSPPNLSGAQLVILRSAFTYGLGQKFIIITNTGAAAQTTAFTNLPQNARITNNSVVFQISYTAGSGNDVQLEVVDAPLVLTGVTRTWDGGGHNGLFNNPANWDGDTLPQDGDSILFPTGLQTGDTVATNNLGIRFDQLVCASPGMSLRGQPLILAGGIIATQATGALVLNSGVSFLNGGSIQHGAGNVILLSSVTNGGADLTITGGSGRVRFDGVVSGGGGLVVSNVGGIDLNNGNLYQGFTRLLQGPVTIAAPGSLGASTNGTFVAEGTSLTVTSTRLFENLINLTGSMTFTTPITSNVLSAIEFEGSNTVLRVGPTAIAEFFGPWSGHGTPQFEVGEFVLNNAHAVAGGIKVANRGRLRINGTGSSDIILGFFDGTLGGTGSVGRVSAIPTGTGRIEPGMGVGILTTSNLVLNGKITNVFELNGTVPGSSHDQLRVGGTINLAGSRLSLSLGYTPAVGDAFTIIDNDGSDAISGTFAGLAEGAFLSVGTSVLRLSYVGGTGNDVVLTAIDLPIAPTGVARAWDGDGGIGNRNMNSAVNWSGNVLPNRGDDLVFPSSVAPGIRLLQNNIPATNAVYNRIWFGGEGPTWNLVGGTLKILAGVVATNPPLTFGNASLGNNLVELIGAQTWSTTNVNLAINSPVALNQHTLTLVNEASEIFVQNRLTGPGELIVLGDVSFFNEVGGDNVAVSIQRGRVFVGFGAQTGPAWQLSGGSLQLGIAQLPGLQVTGGTLDLSVRSRATIDGNLALASAATVVAQFDSPTNVLLTVSGGVDLANARLAVNTADLALLDAPLMLLEKTSAGPVTGTFAGLPEGTRFTGTNESTGLTTVYRISYTSGDGNDVTLTPLRPSIANRQQTWTGAGPNAFWSTSANWSGDNRPPANGETAVFPLNAARRTNTNDQPGLILDAIVWDGSNYVSTGTFSLLSGLRHQAVSGTNRLSPTLLLTYGAQTWTVANTNATLSVSQGDDDDSGFVDGLGPVTKSGPGTLELSNLDFKVTGGLLIDGGTTRLHRVNFVNEVPLALARGTVEALDVSITSATVTNGELAIRYEPVPGEGFLRGGLQASDTVTFTANTTLTVHSTNDAFAAVYASVLNLGNARLRVTFPPSLPTNEIIRVARYSPGSLTGTFANLPNGATTNYGGRTWQIAYDRELPFEGSGTLFITLSPPVLQPRLSSIERQANGDIVLRGTAAPGAVVTIEASKLLDSFVDIGSTVADATGLFTLVDPAPAFATRFYRAIVSSP